MSANTENRIICFNLNKIDHMAAIEVEKKSFGITLEFDGQIIGETKGFQLKEDGFINFDATLSLNIINKDFDEIINQPFIVNLFELAIKTKKSKPKNVNIGITSFGILPLFKGENEYETSLPLVMIKETDMKPLLFLKMYFYDEVQASYFGNHFNIVKMTVESMQNVPDALTNWGINSTCAVAFYRMNYNNDISVLAKSSIVNPLDPQLIGLRKWATMRQLTKDTLYFGVSEEIQPSFELFEDGDFLEEKDKELLYMAQKNKPKLIWNQELRTLLNEEETARLKERLSNCPVIALEVFCTNITDNKLATDCSLKMHGIVFINAKKLLYPGTTRIRGAFRVHPFDINLLNKMVDSQVSVAKDAAIKLGANLNSPNLAKVNTKVSTKKLSLDKKTDRNTYRSETASVISDQSDKNTITHTTKITPVGKSIDEQHSFALEHGTEYSKAKSFLVVEIQLAKPLVHRKTREEVEFDIKPFITPKQTRIDHELSEAKAVNLFRKSIVDIFQDLCDELRPHLQKNFPENGKKNLMEIIDEIKQELFFSLNTSGKFHAFKDKLCAPVLYIVREKYFQTDRFSSQEEIQKFISNLYIYLIQEMRRSLPAAFSTAIKEPRTVNQAGFHQPTVAELLRYAQESNELGKYDLAHHYYQNAITLDIESADNWLAYANFYSGWGKSDEAAECLRKLLMRIPDHTEALLRLGLLLASTTRIEEAKTVLEAVATFDTESLYVWTILGIFYESIFDNDQAERAFKVVQTLDKKKHNLEEPSIEAILVEPLADTVSKRPNQDSSAEKQSIFPAFSESTEKIPEYLPSCFLESAENLFECNADAYADRALIHHEIHLQTYVNKFHISTSLQPQESSSGTVPSSSSWSITARSFSLPTNVPRTSSNYVLFMHELCSYFILSAKLIIRQCGDNHDSRAESMTTVQMAEVCLENAVTVDPESAEAWAVLGNLRFTNSDFSSAAVCFENALALHSWRPPRHLRLVKLRLAGLYLKDGLFEESRSLYMECCKADPTCLSWLGVGITCYRLNDLEAAEQALEEANELNNREPEVWAYLSLVCLHTGRRVEAEQSFKYSTKLGYRDPTVLEELRTLQTKVGFGNPLIMKF